MSLTYTQQLKHPNWQKKRLEVLEAAGWQCQSCRSGDDMLHVHHKQYIKGRMAWDYELENFEALCENCHSDAHESKKLIDEILASLPTQMWMSVASLLCGWAAQYVPEELPSRCYDAHAEEIGLMAWHAGDLDIWSILKLRALIEESITTGATFELAAPQERAPKNEGL